MDLVQSQAPGRDPLESDMIEQSPSCDSELINMIRSFTSKASFLEDGCKTGVVQGHTGARIVTPQSRERELNKNVAETAHHAIRCDNSTAEREKVVELVERAHILIRRESVSPPTINDLKPEDILCRRKMIDWGLRVLGSRCPLSGASMDEGQSIESISIIAVAFS